ncbi:hypothetical protein GIB67_027221 [Kingdonia uniflora]|uniref:Reverse transcriptase zinc-binding domain-containing protein n=1 Tax=Kingdonia uniflora TaxID=39325 RepID=A0A7J7KYD5_9MAGN|nr:hypothetical protein GIB67_027221 [Kingdonia uniflora]
MPAAGRSRCAGVLKHMHGCFDFPKAILTKIEHQFICFLWSGSENVKCLFSAAWVNVCVPKSEGRLGLKRLKDFNESIMMRTLWNLVSGTVNPWTQWVKANYLKDKSFWTVKPPDDCSWAWRSILKKRVTALKYCKIIVGDGKSTFIWQDPWLIGDNLNLTTSRHSIMVSGLPYISKVYKMISANSDWIIPYKSTRAEDLKEIWRIIQAGPKPDIQDRDRMVWTLTTNGTFSSKSA